MTAGGGLSQQEQQSLGDALRAEHAAVYAYGLVAAHAAAQRDAVVAEAAAAHRARRDRATSLLSVGDARPPQAEAGYVLPVAVIDPTTAALLAAEVENETAVAWRSVLERSAPDQPAPQVDGPLSAGVRSVAVDALIDCAVRMALWRGVLGQSSPTTAFPGQP